MSSRLAPWLVVAGVVTMLFGGGSPATAQVRGFADIGLTTFSANESFAAVVGSASGVVFGGGVELVLPSSIFVNVRASQFRKSGERVFVFEGEAIPLGIPTVVTVRPVEFTGGYRFDRGQRLTPYAGGGIGLHRYQETSDFAEDDENVSQSSTGFHLLGGVEIRASQWIAAAGEVQWSSVPNALGQDPNGASSEFGETNLGGTTFRVKVVIGR